MVAWIQSPKYDYYIEYWSEEKGYQNVIIQASGPIQAEQIMSFYRVDNIKQLEGANDG